jgi:DNA gyrase/topoisomerase IV subunit A
LITTEKIDEWMCEVKDRPSSAPFIIQMIANRLNSLSQRYEQLLAENTVLLTGKKIEDYETRIANLEYQLDLLKRQLGGEPLSGAVQSAPTQTVSIFLYTPQGQVLRIELQPGDAAPASILGRFNPLPLDCSPQLLATGTHEELLFLFDSGRTVTMPAAAIPPQQDKLDWDRAFVEEPRGGEELAAIVPIGRMSLSDCCVQASRHGALKKMMRRAFESYVAKNFVGAGVKQTTDRTCGLALCEKGDRVVLASQEGYLLTVETADLSYAIEDSIRLSTSDHILRVFPLGQKPQVVFLTDTGKVILRDTSWLEPAGSSLRKRGQPIFSDERRKTGVRLVGAGAVEEQDWGAALDSDGSLVVTPLRALLGAGTALPTGRPAVRLLAFTVFSPPAGAAWAAG